MKVLNTQLIIVETLLLRFYKQSRNKTYETRLIYGKPVIQ